MIRNLFKKSLIVLVPMSALSAFIEPRKLPISILVGGTLALLNMKGLSRGLEKHLLTQKPVMRLMVLGMLRLGLLASVIILLAAFHLVNLIGLLAGFTVVLTVLLIEGFRLTREEPVQQEDTK